MKRSSTIELQMRKAFAAVLVPIVLLLAPPGASAEDKTTAVAQPWPAKPIRWIVPFAPGGGSDIAARTIGAKLQVVLGQPVVVENKPGAGGGIGADLVAKSPPDGYTLLGGTIATNAINASLYSKLPYDPVRDFAPITLIARVPNLLVIHPDIAATTVAELVRLMKANPGKFTFASAGNGSSQHLAGEMFKAIAGVQMQHVPYKGSPPGLQDVAGGHVSMMMDNIASALPMAKSGKLRALAVTTAKRSAIAPDIPTLAEAGLPGYEMDTWLGVFAPAGTPPEIVERLNAEIVAIINTPEVRDQLTALGMILVADSPEHCAAFVKSETAKWKVLVKKLGVSVE